MDVDRDWKQAGRAVARRRRQLGFARQVDAAKAAGIGVTTWREVEAGRADGQRQGTRAAVAGVLRWPSDAIERLASGEEMPDEPADAHQRLDAVEERLAVVEAGVIEAAAAVGRIEALITDLLRRGADR